MLNDPVANALSGVLNAERRGKKSCVVSPASRLVKAILSLMNSKGYIGGIEEVDTARGPATVLKVTLIGALNKCGAVKPRYSLKAGNLEKYEKKYLPAKGFGFIVLSTSQGIVTQHEAAEKSIGGRVLAYFY
jgi:small subunit ribosomal protein S8